MIGTGLRVGEVTGLRWCDIDMESGMIDVNHTLVYYDHRTEGSKSGCYFNVNTTKTPASMRQVPMLGFVKEAFEQEKQKQEDLGLHIRKENIQSVVCSFFRWIKREMLEWDIFMYL